MDAHVDIRDLLAAAKRGVPDAIGRLFEAARADLMQIADRELPEEVRAKVGPSDVVQETAIDMQRGLARFGGSTREELFAWLREILRNNVVDALRLHRAAIRRDTSREVDAGATHGFTTIGRGLTRTPAGSAIRREEEATLAAALARLSPTDRQVLELRHWQGMKFIDMAPLLGRSEDAVRKQWYRAVARLREELAAGAFVHQPQLPAGPTAE